MRGDFRQWQTGLAVGSRYSGVVLPEFGTPKTLQRSDLRRSLARPHAETHCCCWFYFYSSRLAITDQDLDLAITDHLAINAALGEMDRGPGVIGADICCSHRERLCVDNGALR